MSKNILITNVAYGDEYSNVFLNYHLKSLFDETNLPTWAHRIVKYIIFTDSATREKLLTHPQIQKLRQYTEVEIAVLTNLDECKDEERFKVRYNALAFTLKIGTEKAIENDAYLAPFTADMFFAKNFLTKCFKRIDEDYDSVLVMPLRCAFEPMSRELDKFDGSVYPEHLGQLGIANLHPIWTCAFWDSPMFTREPFSILWNTETGLLVKSYSVTPIVFKPIEPIYGIIDMLVPGMCKNPFWATDWTDAPVANIEFIFCHYPMFNIQPATPLKIAHWAKRTLQPSQHAFLENSLYYPNKQVACADHVEGWADKIVRQIKGFTPS